MTGNDPDEVEAGGKGATSYLSRIGVKPGIPVEGSVTPMFEGKSDIDLNSIALSNEQVNTFRVKWVLIILFYISLSKTLSMLSCFNCY